MLVEQTLDPMVSAYFKNIGQKKTLIELIQQRDEIQKMASEEMKERFAHYNLELEEVLIGTPMSSPNDNKIDAILEQLRDRQIALEQIETYSRQQKAPEKERELREAEARATQQKLLTESEINIQIQTNQGKAKYQRSIQEAQKIKALAEAEAEKEARIGIGWAIAIEEQVKAYGGPQFQVLQDVMGKFTQALEKTAIDIVLETVVAMGEKASIASFNVFEMLLTLILTKELGVEFKAKETEDENIKKIKQEILNSILLAKESGKEEKTEQVSQGSQQQSNVS
ncbi:SPFH domain-containing protein [Caldicellulosiruptor danielii]|uniref:SPFH domain-containing protein n=1 Tax=Anaerocellum danielii TaxID=1387557 RepID=A0ABZ0U0H4_9FIRM|nr:SPFH domain-containing protein [Caldicellulosiruptor danielii]WPX08977.1 SPFH domain-containing protein [Caldicellulosiruptor danielii]